MFMSLALTIPGLQQQDHTGLRTGPHKGGWEERRRGEEDVEEGGEKVRGRGRDDERERKGKSKDKEYESQSE